MPIYSRLNQIDPSTNIIFPPNEDWGYRTRFEILLGGVFQYSIEWSPYIYLYSLIATASWVFITGLFPRTYSKSTNFLNPNHVMKTLVSQGCLLINTHLRHITPLFIPQASKFQKGVTIWITSLMKIHHHPIHSWIQQERYWWETNTDHRKPQIFDRIHDGSD